MENEISILNKFVSENYLNPEEIVQIYDEAQELINSGVGIEEFVKSLDEVTIC